MGPYLKSAAPQDKGISGGHLVTRAASGHHAMEAELWTATGRSGHLGNGVELRASGILGEGSTLSSTQA